MCRSVAQIAAEVIRAIALVIPRSRAPLRVETDVANGVEDDFLDGAACR
jgi:hypothetical protein